MSKSYQEALMDAAMEQIAEDCAMGDFTAIYALLETLNPEPIEYYLSEEVLINLRERYGK